MSVKRNYNKFLDEIIKEVENELDEDTSTGNIDGYETPHAFGDGSEKNKNRKKQVATQAGYSVVSEMTTNVDILQPFYDFLKKQGLPHLKWNEKTKSIYFRTGSNEFRQQFLKVNKDGTVKHVKNMSPSTVTLNQFIKQFSLTESINEVSTLGLSGVKAFAKKHGFGIKTKKSKNNDRVTFTKDGNDVATVDPSITTVSLLNKLLNLTEDRDYKAEYQARKKDYYKKYQSSDKAKKYRAELNQYNRKKGTYGNGDGLDASHKGGKIVGFETENKNRSRKEKSRLKKEDVTEAKKPKRTNRWLELKNDDSMHGHKKLAVGLKELKYQLREVEKFLGWYNKLKNINELDSDNYWKRTNNNIYKIKERLVNIVKKIQEIEK
jgi:hypothetical protein